MRTVFIGWDARDSLAYEIAVRSIRHHAKREIMVIPLKDHELRRAGFYWRQYQVRANGQKIDEVDGKPFSTDFSFARFCVPELARAMGLHEPVLFTDPDILLRSDINELFDLWDDSKSVMCVHHQHQPKETTKFDGLEQPRYFRKNWSSVMLLHPDRTKALNVHKANNWVGSNLHAMLWTTDDQIGALPKEWNHLVGYDEPNPNAKLVHFTLGTPDYPARSNDEYAREWASYLEPDETENAVTALVREPVQHWNQGTGF
jgi:lipopolysaccharide biosynthesis glycosyltransferase